MKNKLIYLTFLSFAAFFGCKEEKKAEPIPEKPKVIPKLDTIAGYFSFKEEEWIYDGEEVDGSGYSNFSRDTVTKVGDTLIIYDGKETIFKKMNVETFFNNNYNNYEERKESQLYFCYKEPNMIKAEWQARTLVFDEYIANISDMKTPSDPARQIDTIEFHGKKFLSANIKILPNNNVQRNFIFGITLFRPSVYSPFYHKKFPELYIRRASYTADGKTI